MICAQADLSEEVTITEQLKAAYTQIGTMAAVMIIFSTTPFTILSFLFFSYIVYFSADSLFLD